MNILRKTIVITSFIISSSGILISYSPASLASNKKTDIVVYKSPTCGCCNKWVTHLEDSGFNVKAINARDMQSVKSEMGVQGQYQSCHTAKVGKYFIEGHVPAADIKKLLVEKPYIKGLAAPGMPMGSPGMEGHRKDSYSVLAIDKQNRAKIYSQY